MMSIIVIGLFIQNKLDLSSTEISNPFSAPTEWHADQIQVKKSTSVVATIRCLITLVVESSIISIDSTIHVTSSGRSLIYSKKCVEPRMEP